MCIDLTAREIYVSPRGDDRNPGTKEQPLASLSGARDLLRQLRAKENLKEEVRIIVEEGTYWMKEPLILNEFDSGSKDAPVALMAEEGANPVFLGGIQIDPENFDFRLKSLSVARKIGFVPFDYSQAGVYGSDEWKTLVISHFLFS